ncbi:MAG: HD domain-containing protein [Firmicutes bacterium]|nr:HD domain-containing protein [Bacillota bacterium]
MERAIGSNINLKQVDENKLAKEYMSYVSDILESPEVQLLDKCRQHCNTSRLQHCLNVSYYAFLMCRKRGLDARSAARAGLLHDFYYYNWRTDGVDIKEHNALHSQMALENACKLFELNEIEKDAILRHMWPTTHVAPKYKESWAVTWADKYCAILEMSGNKLIQVESGGREIQIKRMNTVMKSFDNIYDENGINEIDKLTEKYLNHM